MGKVKDRLFTDTELENINELQGDPAYEEWLNDIDKQEPHPKPDDFKDIEEAYWPTGCDNYGSLD